MGTFILKRKTFTLMPYDPKPRIKAIEGFPFVDEYYEVTNERNITVDPVSISKLFKDPKKYIVPKIYEYERDYDKGQRLGLKDYEDIVCDSITVNGPKDIEFICKAIPGSRLYRTYGPAFEWELSGDLRSITPEVDVIDASGELEF